MATVTDLFEKYIGTKEYNGIVATIQKWYYGYLYKASWCATSMSYMLDQLGLLSKIGKKQQNVYLLMNECKAAAKRGVGTFMAKKDIPKGYTLPRGTIVFNLTEGTVMTETSRKHVTSVYKAFSYKGEGYYQSLGGNQSDYIKVSQYSQKVIYGVYFPPYLEKPKNPDPVSTHPTVKKGSTGDAVKELQEDLNKLKITDKYDKVLVIDGKFGILTQSAVKKFQKKFGLVVDGSCGPKTWAKIDSELSKIQPGTKVKMLTDVFVRSGPGKQYPDIDVAKKDKVYTWLYENGDWLYLKEFEGWVNANYVTTKL